MTATAEQPASLGYVPALDGLRCIAILMVMASHSLGRYAEGGILGVNVFFALSGFLITGILLSDLRATGGIDFRRFYIRRALRLVPAMVVLLALTAFLPWPFPPDEVHSKGTSIAASGLYVANFVVGLTGEGLGHLSHMWSLAVEEQFYIVWPLALLLLSRSRAALRLAAVILGLALAFSVARLIHVTVATDAYEGWPTTHADQLLFGAALAVCLHSARRRQLSALAAWGAAAVLLGTALMLTLGVPHLAPYTVTGAATVLVIWHVVTVPAGFLARCLALPVLVLIGKVSYGIYLFHRPVFRMGDIWATDYGWSPVVRLVVIYSLTALIVTASWVLVERPCLRLKRRFGGTTQREASGVADQDPVRDVAAVAPRLP